MRTYTRLLLILSIGVVVTSCSNQSNSSVNDAITQTIKEASSSDPIPANITKPLVTPPLPSVEMTNESMSPTILSGTIYNFETDVSSIGRYDIVYIKRDGRNAILRVIGLPGESVRFQSGYTYIAAPGTKDYQKLDEPYLGTNSGKTTIAPEHIEQDFIIPSGSYWLMGDNREKSLDSRDCFSTCTHQDKSTGHSGHSTDHSSIDHNLHYLESSAIIGKIVFEK